MMASNASRGAYFKARTRRWLELKGYTVWDMEVVRWVGKPGGARIPIKRDQVGSDLGAMNADEVLFVQCKGGAQALGAGTFPAARREFEKFTFPAQGVRRIVVAWAPRARQPRIVQCHTRLDG